MTVFTVLFMYICILFYDFLYSNIWYYNIELAILVEKIRY